MTTEDQTYNGWKNYPTWAVNLWLSNDEGLYNATCEVVESVTAGYDRDQYATEGVPIRVADALREMVEEMGATVDSDFYPVSGQPVGFTADLLGYALGQVDWLEIADAWLVF